MMFTDLLFEEKRSRRFGDVVCSLVNNIYALSGLDPIGHTESLTSDLFRRIDDANFQLVARLGRHPFLLSIPILLSCLAVRRPRYTIGIPELIFTRVGVDGFRKVEGRHGFVFVWI